MKTRSGHRRFNAALSSGTASRHDFRKFSMKYAGQVPAHGFGCKMARKIVVGIMAHGSIEVDAA